MSAMYAQHTRKRYLHGMVLTSDKIDTVCFKPIRELSKPFEAEYDFANRLLEITYAPDCTTEDLHRIKEVTSVDLRIVEGLQGCYDLMDTITCNDVEYIQGEIPVRTLSQYLVADRICVSSDVVMYDGCCNILIRESDLKDETFDYLNFVNSHDEVYAWIKPKDPYKKGPWLPHVHPMLADYINGRQEEHMSDVVLTNIYQVIFDNQEYKYIDKSIAGLIPDYEVNDVKVFARFIEVLKEKYPTINFYTNPEDRNNTEYNEWIHYKMEHRAVHSNLWSGRAYTSPLVGKFWPTTVDFSLEYSTTDLPRLLARRDEHTTDLFMVGIHKFNINVGISYTGDSFEMPCAMFWDRDELPNNYQQQTEQDDTGYSMYSWTFTGRIQYTNIQYKVQPVSPIITVLCSIIAKEKNAPKVIAELEATQLQPEEDNEENTGVIL